MKAGRSGDKPALAVHRLNTIGYLPALELQERLLEARIAGRIPDTLLLLQHTPVITLGRGSRPEHLLASREALAARGIEVHESGRGGDVTYHGPGQLVGYPIIDLNPDRRDVRRYVAGLEEVMIRIAAEYGLRAGRIAGYHGAWIEQRKLGAVGVRIRRWVTMHGFALNVSTPPDAFQWIVPCGIADKTVTSLERELGKPVPHAAVETATARVFGEVFDREPDLRGALPHMPTTEEPMPAVNEPQRAAEILDFWLGPEAGRDNPEQAIRQRWYAKSDAFDAQLARDFAADLERATRAELEDWTTHPRGLLALVILLDQFTRNLRRGSGRMFENDPRALALAKRGIAAGHDRLLKASERQFLYMPFMHSEQLADQQRSLALFAALAHDAPTLDARSYAQRHHEIVARFGRFPHRNAGLGRTSTAEELAFLEQPNSVF